MKRLLLLFAFYSAFALNLTAQQSNDSPASREDVEKYLQVAHSSDMMKQIIQAMSKPMHEMIHQQAMKDQDKLPPDFEAHMNQIMDDMLNTMPFDEMLQAMVPVYQKHFTHGDLEQLTAFYATPVGQKILREMPAISAEAMQSMMPIMQKQVQVMQERIRQEVARATRPSQN